MTLTPIKDGYLFTLTRTGSLWYYQDNVVACTQYMRQFSYGHHTSECVVLLTDEPHEGSTPITFRRREGVGVYERRDSGRHSHNTPYPIHNILSHFNIGYKWTTLYISVGPP